MTTNTVEDDHNTDVVVVGAGISGLCAAYQLLSKDPSISVVVLEAKARVGGRTLSQNLKAANGSRDAWDLGAQWVGTCQPHIIQLLGELGLETYKQYVTGTKFMRFGSNKISKFQSVIPRLSPLALLDLQLCWSRLEHMRKQVPVDNPYSCEHAAKWDSMSVGTFLQKTVWTTACQEAISAAFGTVFGVETSQLSLLFCLMYMNAAGGMEPLLEAMENCGQESRIKGGAQQISLKLVEKINSDKVWLNQPVVSISQDESSVSVRTATGSTIHCSRVILALPPCQLAHMHFHPHLPVEKDLLIGRMPIGLIIKFIVTYEKAFWREAGCSGEITSNSQWSHQSLGSSTRCCPLSIVFDATTAYDNPALVGFIVGAQYMEWSNVSESERQQAVIDALAEFFGPNALNYLEYVDKDWRLEDYNCGGPVSVVQPGAMMYFEEGIRQPYNRVHFAGTETATVWCGFMNGAVQAGKRAANEVLYHLRPQALSTSELVETAYGPKKSQKPKRSNGKKLVKITVLVGLAVAAWVVVKRGYVRNVFLR